MTDDETRGGTHDEPGDELDPGTDSDRTGASAEDAAREATDSDGDVASGGGEQPA
jgi:hypothetical protein